MYWNNGYVTVRGDVLYSERNAPQDGSKKKLIGTGVSDETTQTAERQKVRVSRSYFKGSPQTSYVMSDVRADEHHRRRYDAPFVDAPFTKLVTGGDLRDTNALGGGMPQSNSRFFGGGVPNRKSQYHRNLAVIYDHKSPVPRG